MNTYTKIETPFERDTEGTKKLIEGKWRNPAVEYLKDLTWICTEKIDGTNIGIVWDGHSISFQGRTANAQIPANLVNKLNELFGGHENEELFEQKFGEMSVVLFGEGYGAKIQNGWNYIPNDCSFILFDVYVPQSDTWLNRDSIEDIAKTFNIDVVPIILKGTLQEAVDFVKTAPKSTIGTANMEGLVCKPLVDMYARNHKRIMVKIKVEDFVK